jgi:hypothetical protein
MTVMCLSFVVGAKRCARCAGEVVLGDEVVALTKFARGRKALSMTMAHRTKALYHNDSHSNI